MWRKRDSDNLESIAESLKKLVIQEAIREEQIIPNDFGILSRIKELIQKEKEIKITDTLNPEIIEEVAIEEDLQLSQSMQNKIARAKRNGNTPFYAEDLFDAEELESLDI